MAIPKGIGREHVLEAIRLFAAGAPHEFGSSTGYDLVHEGRRYPPKAILGLASQVATGVLLRPYDFTGGEASKCFRILRMCGFSIETKGGVAITEGEGSEASEDDLESDGPLEGGQRTRFTTYYERLPYYRAKALEIHGHACMACGFDFEKRYGELGKGFIHVHHNKPVSESGPTSIDPKKDLSVVCPNCHAMIHRRKTETLTVAQLRALLAAQG